MGLGKFISVERKTGTNFVLGSFAGLLKEQRIIRGRIRDYTITFWCATKAFSIYRPLVLQLLCGEVRGDKLGIYSGKCVEAGTCGRPLYQLRKISVKHQPKATGH